MLPRYIRLTGNDPFVTSLTLVQDRGLRAFDDQSNNRPAYEGFRVERQVLNSGTTTQLMLDIADWILGVPADQRSATLARMRAMSVSVLTFATGAGLTALLFHAAGPWCFALPPITSLAARLIARSKGPGPVAVRM